MNGLTLSPLVERRSVDPALVTTLAAAFSAVAGVVGALLLGSRSRGNTHAASNADVLLIVDSLDLAMVHDLTKKRQQAQGILGFDVSLNIHTMADADPALGRWGLFMHKNRAELFIYQAKYTSVVLFGRNVFESFRDPAPSAVRAEAIRVVASFAYFLRKFLFDRSMAPHGAAEFVRTPLIAVEYIAAFHGYLSLGYQDGLDHVQRLDILSEADFSLLRQCSALKSTGVYVDVDHSFAVEATDFLDRALLAMVDAYRRRGVCDIRWNGTSCETHWSLKLPQAGAMTVIRRQDEILLLRRPADDYLYPNQWTIPGGYLQAGEHPADAAARELFEETGLRLLPGALFSGTPVVSNRLAAFAFEFLLPEGHVQTRLAEHDASQFVSLDQVLGMDLTPEARLILARYDALARTTTR